MKKILLGTLLAVLLPCLAVAHDFEVDGIYYNITSEEKRTVEVTFPSDKKIIDNGYKFYKDVVFIPEKVNYGGKEYTVTAIGEDAFSSNDELLSVVMPNTIVSIGKYAFAACLRFKSLTIPRSVNEIGDFAFTLMPSLEHLAVDEWNNTFDSRGGCNAIIRTKTNTLLVGGKKTVIPDGVEVIAGNAFTACVAEPGDLEPFAMNIPGSVEVIEAYAFNGCGSLVAVNFAEGLKRIDRWAFLGTSIERLEIPASVTDINEAFWGCSSLKEIKVKKGNKYYDSRRGCNAIIESATGCLLLGCENTTVPDGVKIISTSAFYRSKIKNIKLPSSLETIERGAFAECKELKKLVIPGSVKNIQIEILCGSGIEELIVEKGVEEIPWYAFFECRKLRYASLPASLKKFGNYGAVFVDCPELVRVDVDKDNEHYYSNGLVLVEKSTKTIIDGWGTEICNAADFPQEPLPVRIGKNAFRGHSLLRFVILPATIEEVGAGAFSNCKNLRQVCCHATVPPVLGKDAFKLDAINGKEFTPLQETLTLLVPEASIEAYKNAPGWKEFKNIISIRQTGY